MKSNGIFRSAAWWSLTALWAVVIFLFSAQDADASSALSDAITEFILSILHIDVSTSTPSADVSWTGLIRSLAHFACFAILGMLSSMAVRSHRSIERNNWWIPFLICLGYAITDEIHQWFVPGRSMQISDIVVDSLGAVVGITFIALIALAAQTKRHS